MVRGVFCRIGCPLRLQPEEVIEAKFVSLEQAEQDSLIKPYCPDSLAALQRYKASQV